MKIVADNKIPFLRDVFEPYASVVYLPGAAIQRAAVHDADALIVRTRTRCDLDLLSGSKVKLVATATIGFDHIATADLAAHGISWANAPGSNSSSVMQYVAAALLTLAHERDWDLAGKTLGIVGVGNVGSKVASLGKLLGMRVLLNDPPRARSESAADFVSLATILAEADFISLHVPLTNGGVDKTYHLVDQIFCAALRRQPVLINTSRGEVVHSAAMAAALAEGRMAAAVLDVWENEPEIDRTLLERVAIGTPHIAGYSLDGKAAATQAAVRAVSQYFSLPLNTFMAKNLPQPPNPLIQLELSTKGQQELLYQAICHSYNIRRDDAQLREGPSMFEQLRENYPLRREPQAYQVASGPLDIAWQDKLSALGFICNGA